jgi:hemolysin activation/secretion protein
MLALADISVGAAAETNSPPSGVASNPVPAKTPAFEIKGYAIHGNTLLNYEQMEPIFKKYVGPAVTFGTVRQALSELQLAYRNRGYVTVGGALPRQQLTNGLVKVQVTEGRLNEINVVGNRYYSSNNVLRALPSLSTNVLLNTKWFQPELDQANANQDRQIYPVIGAGADPGTSALTLKVKDRLPLHGHLELNNRATPGTPSLRVDSTLQYNNLWQLDHQAGVQYSFTPEQKTEAQGARFFDQPLIANYSGFYRVPFGPTEGLREIYDRLPSDFGYDPVSRNFRLPPATGNPELIVYASRSFSESFLRLGRINTITNTVLTDISSQTADRSITVNENIGARFTQPLPEWKGVRSSFNLGADLKDYYSSTYSTNLTYFDLYALDEFGNRVLVKKETIPLDTYRESSITYVPLSYGWSAARPDPQGNTSFSFNQNIYLSALASSDQRMRQIAGSAKAGGNFTTIGLNLAREQKLPNEWSFLFRANGQWASAPLINNEQFGLGGTSGVRGYQEGEEYGDAGWRTLLDLRLPPISIGELPNGDHPVPVHLRPSLFMDYGQRILLDPPPSRRGTEHMLGTGLGFYVTAGQHFDARISVGWAVLSTPGTRAGQARAYFNVGYQF